MIMRAFSLIMCGILCLFLLVFSCTKEKSFENPSSRGTLQSETTGECLPSTLHGTYTADSAVVDTLNYIDLTAQVTKVGDYTIFSDTVDGIFFKGTGNVDQLGAAMFSIPAHGKPTAAGTFTFSFTYGATTCSKDITIGPVGSGGTSVYTFETAAGDCPTPQFAGTYMEGVALGSTNTLTFTVNVTTPGTYSFSLPSDDGDITFTGSGTFTAAGSQTVILTGSGTPQAAGDIDITAGDCDFPLTIGANNLPDAALTANCASLKANGTYQESIATGSGNTATFSATVSTAGKWNISSNEANGVTFSGSGTFATTSTTAQPITLTASGTPQAAGPFTYTLSGNGVTCSFNVTFAAAPAPAAFKLAGDPGTCTGAIVNGTYTAGTAVNSSNTAVISVSVTSAGAYSIATNAVNGIAFSASGLFTQTGTQTVMLQASGNPVLPMTTTLVPQVGSSSCSFDVTVGAPAPIPTGTFTCKIDGTATTFNDRAQAKNETDIFTGSPQITMTGYEAPANGGYVPNFAIYVNTTNGNPVGTGTYTEKLNNTYRIEVDYEDVHTDGITVTRWNTASNTVFGSNPPFTIVITSITPTRIKGTFSGQMTNPFEGYTKTITITDGMFDLPFVP